MGQVVFAIFGRLAEARSKTGQNGQKTRSPTAYIATGGPVTGPFDAEDFGQAAPTKIPIADWFLNKKSR
jgi:hypothetical protein